MMRKLLLLLFALTVTVFAALAQQGDTLRLGYSVRGQVLDARSGRPVGSVHVTVPGRHHATVTNEDGAFVLRSDDPIGEIELSCLGYKKQLQAAGTDYLTVRLSKESYVLDEASIVYGNPRSIVDAARERIWDSYCTQPELLECFYRETVQKGSRYTYVAEAVARLYKHTYDGTLFRDGAALEKSRTLVSQRRRDTLSVKTQGGPTLALSLDAVKNPEVLLSPELLDLYRFKLAPAAYIGDRPQFVVRIEPETEAPFPLYYGTLYIDRELLTFSRIELSMDMSNRGKVAQMLLVSKPASLRFYPEEVRYILNYSLREDGRVRLSYFRSELNFSCKWQKRFSSTRHYTSVNELVVTDLREPAVPVSKKERFRVKDILCDTAPDFYDPDFWEGYNIIAPSESLEHAVERLKKRR